MSVDVEVIREVTDEIVNALNRLLPQLSKSAQPLSADMVSRMTSWDGNSLLVARPNGGPARGQPGEAGPSVMVRGAPRGQRRPRPLADRLQGQW